MKWYDSEQSGCDLQLMTSCRDTPPLRKLSNDTCFGQIIENRLLSKCETKLASPSTSFVQQLRDNFWITSSPEPLHCLKIPGTDYAINVQQKWNMNERVTLPPVALVNVTPGYTIACPGLTLVGRPLISNTSSLTIIYNNSLFMNNISVMDVNRYLKENTTWFDRKPVQLETDDRMKYLQQPMRVPNLGTSYYTYTWFIRILILSWVFFGVIVSLMYYIYRHKRKNNLQNV